ncbi:MAG: argininosuccinate lyase, partial [Planctomycetota bacterium]
SAAHARMLARVGILTDEEADGLVAELKAVAADAESGAFTVEPDDEDCHTAIENRLAERLGDLGKKIHTARSRNDQVIAATRVHAKARLHDLFDALLSLAAALRHFAGRHQDLPMVGRTHTQIAMPSSVGLWAGAWLESLLDDARALMAAYDLNDQCPLGSAASYGVPLPIDREYTAELLGFAKLQNNVLYANNSRGKIESIVLGACVQIALDLSRLAQDLINFSLPEFGYFRIPKELCTGSSIMPQKRNPCGLELIRARASTLVACQHQILGILKGLPSGYNRDLQETKRPFLTGLRLATACVGVMDQTVQHLEVDEARLLGAFTPEVFATDEALRLVVEERMPFRDAYRQVGGSLDELKSMDPREAIALRTHAGGPANLRLEFADAAIAEMGQALAGRRERFERAVGGLMGE